MSNTAQLRYKDITDAELEAMDLDPLFSRVIVKEFVLDTYKGDGVELYLPDSKRDGQHLPEMQTNEGVVVAIGPECDIIASDGSRLEKGDVVYYGRFSGSYFTRNEVEFRIMKQTDIYGKVRRKH